MLDFHDRVAFRRRATDLQGAFLQDGITQQLHNLFIDWACLEEPVKAGGLQENHFDMVCPWGLADVRRRHRAEGALRMALWLRLPHLRTYVLSAGRLRTGYPTMVIRERGIGLGVGVVGDELRTLVVRWPIRRARLYRVH